MTETPAENGDDKRILQIIPANGWVAVYKDDDVELRAPLVAWGLRRDGEVVPLDTDPDGNVGNPQEARNFDRVERIDAGHS